MYNHELSYNTIQGALKDNVLQRYFNYTDDDKHSKCELVSIQNVPVCALVFYDKHDGIEVKDILVNKGFMIISNLGKEIRDGIGAKFKSVDMRSDCKNMDFFQSV